MDTQRFVYINGDFVSEAEAKVSVFDRGFLYGDGAFETMRSYDGRIFRLSDHMQRLEQSARILGLRLGHSRERLAEICEDLLEQNNLSDAIIRISVTRGVSTGGIGVSSAGEPTIVAFARPPAPLPEGAHSQGVSTKIVSIRRVASEALDSRVKPMNFLNYILARAEAEAAGAYEAIMLNSVGNVAEASTGNVFFVAAGKLITPHTDCDILPGITRATVIELAAGLGIDCEERIIHPSEITDVSECFLTNSGVELIPVTRIDDSRVGDGKPGPITARLHEAYRKLTQEG